MTESTGPGDEGTGHHGRRYIVTGAASGIGEATVTHLAELGASVVVADLDLANAGRVSERLVGESMAVELDVRSRSSWETCVKRVERQFGGLDGLVNNAGITRDRSLAKMTDDEWQQVIDVHLRGTWLGSQLCMPLMTPYQHAAIVNVTSSGRHGTFGQANYAAAKAGIVGLTKTVAVEYGRYGLRCNAVSPGVVKTAMTEAVPDHVHEAWKQSILLGRFAEPIEIARVIGFLLSPSASFVTGEVIEVTGGETHL